MSMSKKDFIALADAIREYQNLPSQGLPLINVFTDNQIKMLANFCESQNPRFNRYRWLAYIAGECGPNGGAIRIRKTNPQEETETETHTDAKGYDENGPIPR